MFLEHVKPSAGCVYLNFSKFIDRANNTNIEICLISLLTGCQDSVCLKWILAFQLQISFFISLYR